MAEMAEMAEMEAEGLAVTAIPGRHRPIGSNVARVIDIQ